MDSGIYQIKNTQTGKRYIGSAVSLKQRERTHWYHLRKNIHANNHLQKAYNKYGKQAFEFKVILLCGKQDLIVFEQFFINLYSKHELYNISLIAGSLLGTKRTLETRQKMSKSLKIAMNRPRTKNIRRGQLRGRKHTPESIQKMKQAHMGKISNDHHRKQISQALRGKKKSRQHIENIRKAKMGDKNGLFRHFSQQELNMMKTMRQDGYAYHRIAQHFHCAHSTVIAKLTHFQKALSCCHD